jgi:hypothetical protein
VIKLDFKNSLAYRIYPLYNWLAIHGASEKVLDMFVPILCHVKESWIMHNKEIVWVGISNWKLWKMVKNSVKIC